MVLMLRSSEAEWQEYIWRKTTSTPVGLLLIVMLLIHLEATGSSKARRRAWTDSAVFVGSCCVWIDFPAHCTSSQGKRTKISESIYSVNVEAWILKNAVLFFFLTIFVADFKERFSFYFPQEMSTRKYPVALSSPIIFLVIFSPWHVHLFQLCFLLKLKPLFPPARSELPCDPWELYGMNPQWVSWHIVVIKGDMDGKVGVSLSLWNNKS